MSAETSPDGKSIWKYAAASTLVVLILGLYPQINIWMARGSAWNGAYVVTNYDEVAYSAYINSLIDGRPRTNDPFLGRDDATAESLYSIQVVPAYAIAWPASLFGITASTAFILLGFLLPIATSLAIFLLIWSITRDPLLSAVGTIAVLLLGTAAGFHGEIERMIVGSSIADFFPFLRRYQPGFAFPIFFLFCWLGWRALVSVDRRALIGWSAAAGFTISILIFSYFYLWTAALAWIAVLCLIWFIFRTADRGKTIIPAALIFGFAAVTFVPYAMLLARRSPNMDDAYLLASSRMLNLTAMPELIGFAIIAILAVLVWKKRFALNERPAIFTLSLAATPFVLFNQQVITGRSLQPVHYELFIANYLVLIAAVTLFWLAVRDVSAAQIRKPLIYFGLAAIAWGFIESSAAATRNAGYEALRDEAMPVLEYLNERRLEQGQHPAVISTNLMLAGFIPTVTTYSPLWAPHTFSAGGVTGAENRELFFRYLYYSGFDENDVRKALDDDVFEVRAALFGGGRALSALEEGSATITRTEIDSEIRNYAKFRSDFDRSRARSPQISYIIVPTKAEPKFEKLDQWYTRDAGREFGLFKIYELTLKQ